MRFTNFASGCFGKIIGGLMCVLLGVVLTIGGIGLGGYIAVTRDGMVGTVEDFAQNRGLKIDVDEDLRALSLLDWGKKLLPIFGSLTTTPIGEIESALGVPLLSNALADITGLDLDIIKASTLGDFGKTFAENLTVEQASDNFGIEFPNLPVFQDEVFLASPLSTAFAKIDEFELQDFIEVNDESSPILKSLADLKIGEMSDEENGLDARVNGLKLSEVITIVEEGANKSNSVLIKLKDTKIGELGSAETNDVIMTMTLGEMMDLTDPSLPGGSTKLLWALRNSPLRTIPAEGENPEIPGVEDTLKITPLNEILEVGTSHIWSYLGTATIEDLGQKIDDMNMSDVIEITETSPPILRKMRPFNPLTDTVGNEHLFGTEEIKISELNTKLEPLIQSMKLGDIIPIDGNSEPILRALQGTTIGELNTRIGDLTVGDVFADTDDKVLSLIDSDTLLSEIATELTTTIQEARMQRLINAGAIAQPALNNFELEAGMRNRTIDAIITDYSSILNDPFGGTGIMPTRHYLSASDTVIDMAFISALAGFKEGDTLVLGTDTTISDDDFLTIFNIITDGHTLTITAGATIRCFEYDEDTSQYTTKDKGGYMFISHSVYDGNPIIPPNIVGSFEDPEGIKATYKITIEIIE